jgi:hypothetical protein
VLRLSLNTPVIAIDGLPVGPARAGIALHEGLDPGSAVTVAVRAVRTGDLVCYAGEPSLTKRFDSAGVVDAALAFAEGMGFLFDEDSLGSRAPGARESGERQWRELVSAPGAPAERPADRALPESPPVTAVGARVPLTKFRRAASLRAQGGRRTGAGSTPG